MKKIIVFMILIIFSIIQFIGCTTVSVSPEMETRDIAKLNQITVEVTNYEYTTYIGLTNAIDNLSKNITMRILFGGYAYQQQNDENERNRLTRFKNQIDNIYEARNSNNESREDDE